MTDRPNQRPANVAYYGRNRVREMARVRARHASNLTLLRELRRVACADCRQTFAPNQMDFDHREPSLKSFRLTSGPAMGASRARLLAEVAKCDVVCAVCHRIRTRDQHRRWLEEAERRQGASRYLDRKRHHWRAQSQLLDDLRSVPCADCGRRFAPCAMDFDHREPTGKVSGVTRMIGRAGKDRILAEVAKCDIVCANCHRARTHSRRTMKDVERE